MIKSEKTLVKFNARNKKRLVELGYKFTKIGDEVLINVSHLTSGSTAIIEIECDICKSIYSKEYRTYLHQKKNTVSELDSCNNSNCMKKKIEDSSLIKYGVKHHITSDVVQEKVLATVNERYGVINVFELDETKKKIEDTNMEKYGVKHYTQTKEHQERVKKTSLEKYGHTSHMKHPKYRKMFTKENSPRWKGGVKHHRVERSTYEYGVWRRSVFCRDLFRCQCCKAKNGEVNGYVELQAHHIINWKNNIKDRYNIDNGITLCYQCHINFHSIYGKLNNNGEQIREFILNHGKNVC